MLRKRRGRCFCPQVFPQHGRFLERLAFRMLSERVQLEDHLVRVRRRLVPLQRARGSRPRPAAALRRASAASPPASRPTGAFRAPAMGARNGRKSQWESPAL